MLDKVSNPNGVFWSSDAKTMYFIDTPTFQVAACAFGGANLEDLYITTATAGLNEVDRARQPGTGGLFRARPGVKGIVSPHSPDSRAVYHDILHFFARVLANSGLQSPILIRRRADRTGIHRFAIARSDKPWQHSRLILHRPLVKNSQRSAERSMCLRNIFVAQVKFTTTTFFQVHWTATQMIAFNEN